jgi:acyl-CoA reductase-like NAD-dependent aldehyde dehydrogenase
VPEARESGKMMIMKKVHVEWAPLGVIGAIVPWNYPFHNVFNPVSAALFSGNAIVIKVSEYASWSIRYYKAIIDGCLDAVGAPRDLVQFVVGYGMTGSALVTGGVDKVIFVGSPGVGVIVARTAADNLTPGTSVSSPAPTPLPPLPSSFFSLSHLSLVSPLDVQWCWSWVVRIRS